MDHPLLRLTQSVIGDGMYRVETSLDVPGQARRTAVNKFKFALTDASVESASLFTMVALL